LKKTPGHFPSAGGASPGRCARGQICLLCGSDSSVYSQVDINVPLKNKPKKNAHGVMATCPVLVYIHSHEARN
jgi:hypothetical protein